MNFPNQGRNSARVTQITYNGQVICSAMREPSVQSYVDLEHTFKTDAFKRIHQQIPNYIHSVKDFYSSTGECHGFE